VRDEGVAQTAFREGYVEVDGVLIRYMEAGQGPPLVHVHPADGLRLTPAHDLLCRRFRVVALELPEGPSPEHTLARAIATLGIDTFNLVGTSFGGPGALWLALHDPQRVLALVLEAPAARPDDRDGDLERRLANLATPTLVLFGTMDAVAPPALGRVYKALMPNCHLVFVYAAAHAISADRPEAFSEVVIDFLERHEAFVISRAQTVIHP
jgi:pimeloyl-ACP methyl ester carboxylesterase